MNDIFFPLYILLENDIIFCFPLALGETIPLKYLSHQFAKTSLLPLVDHKGCFPRRMFTVKANEDIIAFCGIS